MNKLGIIIDMGIIHRIIVSEKKMTKKQRSCSIYKLLVICSLTH